jgi:hypothetical protein
MISELTKQLLEKFTNEIKQPHNYNKIKTNVLDPMILYASYRLYPYFLIIVILFIIVVILSLTNFFLLLKLIFAKQNNVLN